MVGSTEGTRWPVPLCCGQGIERRCSTPSRVLTPSTIWARSRTGRGGRCQPSCPASLLRLVTSSPFSLSAQEEADAQTDFPSDTGGHADVPVYISRTRGRHRPHQPEARVLSHESQQTRPQGGRPQAAGRLLPRSTLGLRLLGFPRPR